MVPRALARCFGVVDADALHAAERLAQRLPRDLPEDWRALAAVMTHQCETWLRAHPGATMILGVSGGQGAGKSTLARALLAALADQHIDAATLSLDDVYLTRAARQQLSRRVHPLLATRGVPGTHDVALLNGVLDRLQDPTLRLPRFDKASDDRLPMSQWATLQAPLQVLVFEGWCLGVTPQTDAMLQVPVNALEAEEDPRQIYRRYVNDRIIKEYLPLWDRMADWLYLAVPDLTTVRRWRSEQEAALPGSVRMTAAQLERFVAHYERLTLWLQVTAQLASSWYLALGADHRLQFIDGSAPGR